MLDGDVAALSSLGQCSNLETPRIDHNKLHGSLHLDLTKWPGLDYFCVGGNKLSGDLHLLVASTPASLLWISARTSLLEDFLPKWMEPIFRSCVLCCFHTSNLKGLYLHGLETLKCMQRLDLSQNKLTSSIPETLCSLDGYRVQTNANNNSLNQLFHIVNQNLRLTLRGDSVSSAYIL